MSKRNCLQTFALAPTKVHQTSAVETNQDAAERLLMFLSELQTVQKTDAHISASVVFAIIHIESVDQRRFLYFYWGEFSKEEDFVEVLRSVCLSLLPLYVQNWAPIFQKSFGLDAFKDVFAILNLSTVTELGVAYSSGNTIVRARFLNIMTGLLITASRVELQMFMDLGENIPENIMEGVIYRAFQDVSHRIERMDFLMTNVLENRATLKAKFIEFARCQKSTDLIQTARLEFVQFLEDTGVIYRQCQFCVNHKIPLQFEDHTTYKLVLTSLLTSEDPLKRACGVTATAQLNHIVDGFSFSSAATVKFEGYFGSNLSPTLAIDCEECDNVHALDLSHIPHLMEYDRCLPLRVITVCRQIVLEYLL
jgi:hypothetical protein